MVSEAPDQLYVIDAHSLYWYWENPGRLSLTASAVFASMERREAEGLIPAIVVAAINYFTAKLRAPMPVDTIIGQIDRAPAWRLEPLTRRHLQAFGQLTTPPEMHNRLIAAVAQVQNATILTRDPQLHGHPLVRAVW